MVPRSLVLAVVLLVACATSPLGRRQLMIFPEAQMDSMGVEAFAQVKKEMKQSNDPAANSLVRCVAKAITDELPAEAGAGEWEVQVFQDDSANAFALPGRKIGVHTGLLRVARNQDQLATVLGHEVAHVLAGHGNERMSQAFAAQTALDAAQILAGAPSPQNQQIFALLGLGAQVGILLPFSRTQESEADLLGLDLMAKAGFDPRQSVELWRNMAAAGGAQPPEFLSTHPSHDTRIQDLQERIPDAMSLYQRARGAGKAPHCS
jgi:predicted Zn-dependent protease